MEEIIDSKEFRKSIIRLEKIVKESLKKNNDFAVNTLNVISDYSKIMDRIQTSLDLVEETLMNVLLAIRQNEYLQAWYPAQSGHPEMKVVGRHPRKYDNK